MIKKKEVRVCDYCGEELTKPFITTEGVPNEGESSIDFGEKSFYVGYQDYCNIDCLVSHIRESLGIDEKN